MGESELYAEAYNPEWHYNRRTGEKICQGSYGVFQIACVHHMENPEALYDPLFNIEMAKKIRDNRGSWTDWGAYTDGRYLAYLR